MQFKVRQAVSFPLHPRRQERDKMYERSRLEMKRLFQRLFSLKTVRTIGTHICLLLIKESINL